MKPVAPPIFAPLSGIEPRVLRAYVEHDKETIAAVSGAEAVAWAEATVLLKARGFLLVVDRGVLVTPEGLAAALDMFPAELLVRAGQHRDDGRQGRRSKPRDTGASH